MTKRAAATLHERVEHALATPPVAVAFHPMLVDLDRISESPINPRKHVDTTGDAEMADSIARHGVLEPIVVRPELNIPIAEIQPDTRFEIIAGSRRFRASRLAGRTEIPVTVRDVNDTQLLELALHENLQRRSMHVLDEAAALHQLQELDRAYLDLTVLAAKIGRPVAYVRDSLRLLRLNETVAAALLAEAITVGHAHRISKLPAELQGAALRACFPILFVSDSEYADSVRTGAWPALAPSVGTVAQLEEWVERHGKADLASPEVQQQLAPEIDRIASDALADRAGRHDATEVDDVPPADAELERLRDEVRTSLLQLSQNEDYQFTRKEAKATGVIRFGDWFEVRKSKDRCDHMRKGAVVHGLADGEAVRLVDVCVDKRRCEKHWPKSPVQSSAKPTAAEEKRQREAVARQEEETKAQEAWRAMQPAAMRALGPFVLKQRLSPMGVVRAIFDSHDIKRAEETYGIPLNDRTALAYLLVRGVRLPTWRADDFYAAVKQHLGIKRNQIETALRVEAEAKAKATGRKRKAS